MRTIVCLLYCLAMHGIAFPASGQPAFVDLGRTMLAGSGVALAPEAFLASSAGTGIDRVSASILRLYGIAELQPVRLSVERRVLPYLSVASSFDALALEGFARHALAVSAGLGDARGGARFTLVGIRTRTGRYAPRFAAFPGIAVRTRVMEGLSVGLRIDPPPDSGAPDRNRVIAVGFAWHAPDGLALCVDRIRQTPNRPGTAVGLQWSSGPLQVRAGWSSSPPFRSLGFVIVPGRTRIGLLAAYHDPLGWTPGVGVEWR